MSSDEDTELRDLVAQTLESNGVLGKIRAELRANVFLTLEEQESVQNKTPFLNKELKQFLATKEGRLVAGLVEEFLECFNLEFTQAVFEPESGVKSVYEGRQILAEHLSLKQLSGDGHKEPLLKEVVSRLKGDNSSSAGSADFQPRQVPSAEAWTIPEDLSSKQIQDARRKFDNYDTDQNGIIDKDELRNLFTDIFPSFHRNMLERYVNDEFRAVDKDFSNSIDFEEFLGMYRRLFVQCRSVVAGDVADLVNSSNKSNLSNASVDKSEKSKGDYRGDDPRSGPNSLSQGRTKPDLDPYSSDVEEDPFFDDPVPSTATPGLSAISKGGSGDNSVVGKLKDEEESPPLPKTKPPELSSLPADDTKSKEENSHLRALDKRMSDMDLSDMGGDFQYEDDFLSTQSVSQKSPRTVSKSEVRTLNDGSISEEIEEEIDDISIEADDLLKSQNSAFDDLTTDRTISQHDTGFDYAEDIQLP